LAVDYAIRIWDVGGPKLGVSIPNHGRTDNVKLSADFRRLATCGQGESSEETIFWVWDAESGRPNSRRLVTVSGEKTLQLWDGCTGFLLATYDGHVQSLGFTPDSRHLVTAFEGT
jgi:WD40 repeat protein